MIKTRHLFIIIIVFLTAFSCSNPNKSYIKKISMLQQEVNDMKDETKKMDINFFREKYSEISKNMEIVKSNMDKIDMNDTSISKYIGAYGTLWKTMGRTFKKQGALNIEERLLESEKQLKDLKHDIKHKILTNPEVIKTFIKSEQKEVERLKIKVETVVRQFKTQRERYYKLTPRTEEIIEPFKNQ